jgi:hypothetical protein
MKIKKSYVEQRNKYLEDLGLRPEDYGVNFSPKNDKRRKKWAKQKEKFGFDERETWSLDHYFAEWLYSHCRMYLKEAGKVIDLEEEDKYEIDGKKYNQKEAIEKILELLEFYLTNINHYKSIEKEAEAKDALKEASGIWSEIILDMWW